MISQEEHLKSLLYAKHKKAKLLGSLSTKCRILQAYSRNLLVPLSDSQISGEAITKVRKIFDEFMENDTDKDVLEVISETIKAAEELEALRKDINVANGINA